MPLHKYIGLETSATAGLLDDITLDVYGDATVNAAEWSVALSEGIYALAGHFNSRST